MQLTLFSDVRKTDSQELVHHTFSHDSICFQDERLALEKRYAHLLEETDLFNRKSVSYQGNKGELIHGWIRYKEGFSAQLVETLMRQFDLTPGDTILEPFAGSATTLLVAKSLGINAIGVELLPVCHLAWSAKSHFPTYDITELRHVLHCLEQVQPGQAHTSFPHIVITEGAFPPQMENDLMFFTDWFAQLGVSDATRLLAQLVLTSILEEISYTRKDGQYLRWDYRSQKVSYRNNQRELEGKALIKKVDKGELPSVKQALIQAWHVVLADIQKLQSLTFIESQQELYKGNTLYLLPTFAANQFSAVITSPPYCNRYDYTRTYALELAYLSAGTDIFALRQGQLSCTVESRSKLEDLETHYLNLGQNGRFATILNTVNKNPAFQEINTALRERWRRGEINNRGILPMVEQYFTELSFVFAELFRVCRPGAPVAFVNDNVRYGGEIIPVDLLTTSLAESLGFKAEKVYVLPQRKGNSSQQMGRFGREALRKSITVWRKPHGSSLMRGFSRQKFCIC